MSVKNVTRLSSEQQELVSTLAERLGAISGVKAVVLGGSHARGRAKPGSDIDLGILYSEGDPFSIQDVRGLANELNDTPEPVVTGFYEWGPWVNGGAWLTIRGQRVDFVYRSVEHLERVIAAAQAGRYEVHYEQQPPFGFFSVTYLGEIAICQPLFDPERLSYALKQRVVDYPEALRKALVQDYLWQAELNLGAFAGKFAKRMDSYGTAACLTRAIDGLVKALFALNRRYLINDKTALEEIAEFECSPRDFSPRVQELISNLGSTVAELDRAVSTVLKLHHETVDLTDGLYVARYNLPI